jgi:hypothetical protein
MYWYIFGGLDRALATKVYWHILDGLNGAGYRGGIDKNFRKIICPKINFEVWKL